MARVLVWLLLLLNVLYWSWAQGWLLPCGAVDPLYSTDMGRDTEDLIRRGIKLGGAL